MSAITSVESVITELSNGDTIDNIVVCRIYEVYIIDRNPQLVKRIYNCLSDKAFL